MMKVRYKEQAQIGLYSTTGHYVEFKAGEIKEVAAEIVEQLKNDSRFEILNTAEAAGNEAPAATAKKKSKKGDD